MSRRPRSFDRMLDRAQGRKRDTINMRQTSTPKMHAPTRSYSISLSGIDTASSSDNEIRRQQLLSKSRISKTEVRKRNKVLEDKKRRKKKKRVVVESRDDDNEWETRSVESVRESVINLREKSTPKKRDDDSARCNLFEDLGVSDYVRDAPITFNEPLYESPILRAPRKSRLISEKDRLMQHDELPLRGNLRSLNVGDVSSEETDEEELIFHHENVRTYPPAPRRVPLMLQFPARYPSPTLSNKLWDEFISKNRDDVAQCSAPSSSRAPVKTSDFARGSNVPRKLKVNPVPDVSRKPKVSPASDVSLLKSVVNPIPPNMECIWGHWDIESGKWTSYRVRGNAERSDGPRTGSGKTRTRDNGERARKTIVLQAARDVDVYDRSSETRNELETDGKRISFREFRRRMNERKLSSTARSNTQ